MTRAEFTNKYYPMAKQVARGSRIYPETILAVAIVESQGKAPNGNWEPGRNAAAKLANNFFGIKANSNYKGEKILLNTPGDAQHKSYFRKYPTIAASFKDYIDFLKTNPRYKTAGVFDSESYQEQIINIARAGYAESKSYADVVINVANNISKLIKEFKPHIEIIGKTITALTLLILTLKTFADEK